MDQIYDWINHEDGRNGSMSRCKLNDVHDASRNAEDIRLCPAAAAVDKFSFGTSCWFPKSK